MKDEKEDAKFMTHIECKTLKQHRKDICLLLLFVFREEKDVLLLSNEAPSHIQAGQPSITRK